MGSEDFIVGLGHRWSRTSDIVTNNFMFIHMLFDCFVMLFMIQSFSLHFDKKLPMLHSFPFFHMLIVCSRGGFNKRKIRYFRIISNGTITLKKIEGVFMCRLPTVKLAQYN